MLVLYKKFNKRVEFVEKNKKNNFNYNNKR